MARWRREASGRRRAWFALALLAHVALIATMLRSRVSHDRAAEDRTVEATILLRPAPPPRVVVTPLPPPRPTRLRAIPLVDADPRTIRAPALEAQPIAQAASAPEPPASAASAPLNLTLTRDQIKALIAQSRPTLAQLGPHAAQASPFDRLAGDGDGITEIQLPHGVTEVHLHGECYRLVPTPRAQSDPFNHGNERLTGPCIGNF